jgi:hypothetical protein
MPNIVSPARHRLAMLAALAGLAMLAAPIERALGAGAPVTVVNPATSPALTSSVDDPGRIPYQFSSNGSCQLNGCTFRPPADVPIGKRLVIQHFSTRGSLASAATSVEASIDLIGGVSASFAPTLIFGGRFFVGDQAVELYVAEGATFIASLGSDADFVSSSRATSITITGYLLDCNVSPCAAIVP